MSSTTMTSLASSSAHLVPAGLLALDVSASGTLDASTALEIREAIVSHLSDEPCLVLVDIGDVDRVATSGRVGTLVLLHLTRRHGGDLRPYGSSPALDHARAEFSLAQIVRVYPTRDLAIRGHVDRIANPGRARRWFGQRGVRR